MVRLQAHFEGVAHATCAAEGSKFAMEQRQKSENVSEQVTALLLEAVKKIESSQSTPGHTPSQPHDDHSSRVERTPEVAASTSQRLEMSRLFNWSGMGCKRKVLAGGRPTKKKKLQMFTHTFFCLAHTNQQ